MRLLSAFLLIFISSIAYADELYKIFEYQCVTENDENIIRLTYKGLYNEKGYKAVTNLTKNQTTPTSKPFKAVCTFNNRPITYSYSIEATSQKGNSNPLGECGGSVAMAVKVTDEKGVVIFTRGLETSICSIDSPVITSVDINLTTGKNTIIELQNFYE